MGKPRAEAYLNSNIKSRFGLKKTDVDSYRRQLSSMQKALDKSSKKEKSNAEDGSVPIALFDGLVDLVEQDGVPTFLIKNGENITVECEVVTGEMRNVPPSKEQIPWLLPRAEEVLKHYQKYSLEDSRGIDGTLFHDLVAYLKQAAELPNDNYYVMLAAWLLHTIFARGSELYPHYLPICSS